MQEEIIKEDNIKSERLNKFIAANGHFSRRKIDEFILEGRVTVNGKEVFNLGTKINPDTDKVFIDGERVRVSDKKIYLMMNKPLNVITSVRDDKKRTTVIDLLNIKSKVFPIGRLDFHTTGLLILTNDGDFTNKLMNPAFKVWKTYDVKLSRPLEQKHRQLLEKGIKLDGVYTLPAKISVPDERDYTEVQISISQGKNRQVRRMFEHFGYFVNKLHRSAYGNLQLGNLREGETRKLTNEEVQNLITKDSKVPQIIAKKEEPKKTAPDKLEGNDGKKNLTRGNKEIKLARYNKDSNKKDFKNKNSAKKGFKKDFKKDFKKSFNNEGDSHHRESTPDEKKKSFSKNFGTKPFNKSGVKSHSKNSGRSNGAKRSFNKEQGKSPSKSFGRSFKKR